MVRYPALLSGLIALALTTSANAEVTRFNILERAASVLQGRSFGAAGQVEKIAARATIALDPANPHNSVITDLDRAPRNADGKVEAISDVVILRPAHPNGILLFEIPNRGRRLISAWFDNSSIQGSIRLEQADDMGRGFLLSQGYTLVWAGWQADSPTGAGLLGIQVPVVTGITGPVREEWSFGDTTNPHRATLSYPVADRASAQLSVHARADDPRQTPPELKFSFVDDTTIEITRPPGLIPDALYELTYTALDSKVTGMGLAAIRDVTAFLRRERGPTNPLAADGQSGISRAIGLGISQSGRVLRDVLYFGMNEDEAGRLVFDAMMPIIPGARRSFTNDRFAEPGRNPGPEFDRLYPVLRFPFTYAVTEDAFTGRRDGLLLRCGLTNTCPRIMQVDSEFEFWGSEASLLVTDTRGRNLEPPPEVRLYMVAGSPHGNVASAVVTHRPTCTLPLNPVYGGPAFRALLTDLRAWIIEDLPPPANRYPTLAQNTLVAAGDVFPVPIPGLGYRAQYARAEAIEQATPLPKVRGEYPLYLPRAGADGNALAGIRLPLLAAARATYTGWNAIAGADGAQTLCSQMGGTLAFAGTRAERLAAGDPRPSIEELYPTPDAYVAAVKAASMRMVDDRLLLPEDAADAIAAAQAGTLARLAP
ncbi:alpha/beta hydrolase domain-containing protein [Bradyrhizobium sp. CCGUVB23]|uniref:alpha/beta hydrolase domain-containing protein n=1 Tax=Bradyrhizobium sp. CCGUVB23 TaxID=2949630 RepID=UPI0020B1C001|nr:alpha/beta hydrolase domain-containing protein [Bradyrhizobium sp. CCGUVB23]MCP3467722.1 alpha/beta hydrolase domain-containing protein [Bradyrhizobium sp. CCGUVB23]